MNRSFQFSFKGTNGDSVIRVIAIQNDLWFAYEDLYSALCLKEQDPFAFLEKIHLAADERRLMDASFFPNLSSPPTGEIANLGGTHVVICISTLAVYKLVYRSEKAHGRPFRIFLDRTILPAIQETPAGLTPQDLLSIKIDFLLYRIRANLYG